MVRWEEFLYSGGGSPEKCIAPNARKHTPFSWNVYEVQKVGFLREGCKKGDGRSGRPCRVPSDLLAQERGGLPVQCRGEP